MKVPTGRAHGLAHVLDWAAQRGASRERPLARIPISRESLDEPESRMPVTAYYAEFRARRARKGKER